MGLNLRSDSDSIAHFSKETRYRVWWALFVLDTVLCVMTGRPPSSDEVFCTTPLPIPYREEDFWDEEVVQLIADRAAFLTFFARTAASGVPGGVRVKSSIRRIVVDCMT